MIAIVITELTPQEVKQKETICIIRGSKLSNIKEIGLLDANQNLYATARVAKSVKVTAKLCKEKSSEISYASMKEIPFTTPYYWELSSIKSVSDIPNEEIQIYQDPTEELITEEPIEPAVIETVTKKIPLSHETKQGEKKREKKVICFCQTKMEEGNFDNTVNGITIKNIPGFTCPKCKERFMKKTVENHVKRILYQANKEREENHSTENKTIDYPEDLANWEKRRAIIYTMQKKEIEKHFSHRRTN